MILEREESPFDGLVGDFHAPRGSREWAVAVRREIQTALEDVNKDAEYLEDMACAMRKFEGWKQLAGRDGLPFSSYEGFCVAPRPEGLGYRAIDIDRIVDERKARSVQERALRAKPLALHGGVGRGRDRGYIITSKQRGTDPDYLTARIARDRPDILERMKAGEFKSVREAAIAAGIIKTLTKLEEVKRLAGKLTKSGKSSLVRWLMFELGESEG